LLVSLSAAAGEREFAGKVCIVTGAARGIGAGIAATFARRRGLVAIVDRDGSAAVRCAALLVGEGCVAVGLEADVTRMEDLERMVADVERDLGPPEVLVNNAGLFTLVPSAVMSESEWRLQVDVLLTGTFFPTRAVVPGMLERGRGAIVNISSIGGLGGHPGRAAYNAAKAGIVVLTQVLGVEWAMRGIRVNAVAPGVVRTQMTDEVLKSPAGQAALSSYERRTPMLRIAEVDEIANAVAFLASSRATFITGTTLPVDGGWLASDGFPENTDDVLL
jgi:NAD(P)-dependent dehydrogenase (short-subunit alcohol dehydrogenase family)